MHPTNNASSLSSTLFVIFGAGGDLTWRKLMPALYNLWLDGWLPHDFVITGIDRRQMSKDDFAQHIRDGIDQFSRQGKSDDKQWADFATHLDYVSADFGAAATFADLAERVAALGKEWSQPPNVVYYLAISPALIQMVVEGLGKVGLADDRDHASIVVEKPFGRDLDSARALNSMLTQTFAETQIYRIDHYLGKETVQNILAMRFANAIFEPLWNRTSIERVEITVAESVGVEHRGGYYDHAGAVRDMIQNHLLQIFCLISMEPPIVFAADEIRDKKVEVLRAVRPIAPEKVDQLAKRGQYEGYRQEPDVSASSNTETFAQLTLHVDNWRWQGVPFVLRTGKALKDKVSLVKIRFRSIPHRAFPAAAVPRWPRNELQIHIQPNEGIDICMLAKEPGPELLLKPVDMNFRYSEDFAKKPMPEAYETLLLDVMQRDATLFMRGDQVETAWRVVMPVLDAWGHSDDQPTVYPVGSWGP
ncbi:MAG: glucose-6-phosphate dehydrogenase [Caldilineaceae bacterium]|nr:glucose-6-phosphate dehydrogenase [Caldilineaceae bacterium]